MSWGNLCGLCAITAVRQAWKSEEYGAGSLSTDTLTHWTSACKCAESLCNKSHTEEHSHTTGGYFKEIMCLYQREYECGGENEGTYLFQRSQSQIGKPEGDLQALITTHTLSIRDCEVWQHSYVYNIQHTAWTQVSWFFFFKWHMIP